jgi:peptidoglycan/xylan/chitin deacetylase (PgdA/CDA1 family)
MIAALRPAPTRRDFLATTAFAAVAAVSTGADPHPPAFDGALVAISLDLEMARNFPHWEDLHWDYEKGNLNEETKRYAVEAGRRIKAHGGRAHYFLVGRALEQENVEWLHELVREGHAIGNHTYDHVHLKAATPRDVQFRFQRAPWLIEEKSVAEILRENILLCTSAMKARLGISPAGFRTPGGFANGLRDTPHLQRMLREVGFDWVSATYPAHPNTRPGEAPTPAFLADFATVQLNAQPFVYDNGLIDVPMSPPSDVVAFRNGQWKLEAFLEAIRAGVDWAIQNRACYDFLAHPAVLAVKDPGFRAIELICELVHNSSNRAKIVTLGEFAKRAQ